jgi:hypothetical protein
MSSVPAVLLESVTAERRLQSLAATVQSWPSVSPVLSTVKVSAKAEGA